MKFIKESILSTLALCFASNTFAEINSVNEPFTFSGISSSWILGNESTGTQKNPYLTAAAGIDTDSYGWLRLTESIGNQATYAAYMGEALAAENLTIYCSFDFSVWDKGGIGIYGADGICFYLFDGSVGSSDFRGGAFGGSLGYAQKGSQEGLKGAYIGIGIDEYGNFSTYSEGRIGGESGTSPGNMENTIAIRGDEASGWKYLTGTFNPDVADLPRNYVFPDASRRPNFTPDERKMVLIITETNQLTAYMRYGTGDLDPVFTVDLSDQIRPETLRFGFAASTGGGYNVHEIRNVIVHTFSALQWDSNAKNGELDPGDTGNLYWTNPASWVLNSTPDELDGVETVKFDNQTGLTSRQDILLDGNHTVKSITIDSPFAYTFNGEDTLIFDSPTEGLFINVTGQNGNAFDEFQTHAFNCNIKTSATLNISITNDTPVTFSKNINNNDNLLRFTGSGEVIVSGTISGGSGIEKSDGGTLYFVGDELNSFEGDTLIRQGTIRVGKGTEATNVANSEGSLGKTTIEIQEGGALYLEANNQIYNGCDMHLSGGEFHLNGFNETEDVTP